VLVPGPSLRLKNAVNAWAYPAASLGSGLALAGAAWTRRGRSRHAWLLISLGVLSWSIGETGSEIYWAAGREVPYPGWVDIFFLLGYPLLAAGVALLPRLRLGSFERVRSAIDAAVGVGALCLLAWLTYLDHVIAFDPGATALENWINALYPMGDAILLLGVMGIGFRRIERRFGLELLALGGALLLHAAADMFFFTLSASGAYYDGMWLDGVWLLGYASLAAAAWLCAQPSLPAATRPARSLVRLAVAYGPVLALLALALAGEKSEHRYLTLGLVAVAALIVTRQWVATRETREIVEGGRDALLASVSHDLRTPLTAVQGYSALLAEDWDGFAASERQEMLQTIQDAASHLGKLCTDIIDVTRGRTGTIVLDRRPCPADRLLRRAVAALPPGVAATVAIEAEPGLVIDVDTDRIHQVLVNFLGNAVRYGKPPLLARAVCSGRDILFEVHDAGDGVPKKHEAAIWERFERGAFRAEASPTGLGLGLSIAKALVEAHGGAVGQHRSARLGGACFHFTVPAATPRPAAASPPDRSPVVPVAG
jgi:signal transduction histidine kinase